MATVCTLLWRLFMSEAAPRGAKRAAPAPPPARANAWRELLDQELLRPARLATDLRRLHAL